MPLGDPDVGVNSKWIQAMIMFKTLAEYVEKMVNVGNSTANRRRICEKNEQNILFFSLSVHLLTGT